MVKKKTEKKSVRKVAKEVCNSETEIARLDGLVEHLAQSIHNINARIERLVDAIGKSKSVRGL